MNMSCLKASNIFQANKRVSREVLIYAVDLYTLFRARQNKFLKTNEIMEGMYTFFADERGDLGPQN